LEATDVLSNNDLWAEVTRGSPLAACSNPTDAKPQNIRSISQYQMNHFKAILFLFVFVTFQFYLFYQLIIE